MGASRFRLLALVGVAALVSVLAYVAAQEQPAAVPAPPTADVVIVWAGGSPDAPRLPSPDEGAVDAVTHATPAAWNIKDIAQKLGKELESAGLTVLVTAADDCRDPRTIIQARVVVLASPDYFGMPVWQMVRFLDDTMYRIYRARPKTNVVAYTSFATTERVAGILQQACRATGGKPIDSAVIRPRRGNEEQCEAAMKEFAGRIVAVLKPQPAPAPETTAPAPAAPAPAAAQ